jgi:hypothetical protein
VLALDAAFVSKLSSCPTRSGRWTRSERHSLGCLQYLRVSHRAHPTCRMTKLTGRCGSVGNDLLKTGKWPRSGAAIWFGKARLRASQGPEQFR